MSEYGDIAYKIMHEYNFNPQEESYYELWDLDDGNTVVRFANIESSMRVHVLYDPDLDT